MNYQRLSKILKPNSKMNTTSNMKIKDYCQTIISIPNLNMKTIKVVKDKIWFHNIEKTVWCSG